MATGFTIINLLWLFIGAFFILGGVYELSDAIHGKSILALVLKDLKSKWAVLLVAVGLSLIYLQIAVALGLPTIPA